MRLSQCALCAHPDQNSDCSAILLNPNATQRKINAGIAVQIVFFSATNEEACPTRHLHPQAPQSLDLAVSGVPEQGHGNHQARPAPSLSPVLATPCFAVWRMSLRTQVP